MEQHPAAVRSRTDALPLNLVAIVWLPFACGHFLSYGLRMINAVLAPDLTRDFDLSAADLGLITSIFYVVFGCFQLPAGVLLDRYGPRRVNAMLLLLAAAGCLIFATSSSPGGLVLGRGLLGLGVSVCLMSSMKAFSQWFPLPRLPLAISLLLTAGGIGAIVTAGPVGWALDYVSWRSVFIAAAALCLAVSALVFLVVPNRPEAGASESFGRLIAGFGTIFANATYWRLALVHASIGGTLQAVQSLWVGPWLRDVGGLSKDQVIAMITGIGLAATVGFAVMGVLIDALIRRGVRPHTLLVGQAALSIVLFALIAFGGGAFASVFLIAYFFIGSVGMLSLPILTERFPARLTGRVNTACNVLIFAASFAGQWAVGIVLDQWPAVDGHYSVLGYRAAFAMLLAVQVLSFFGLLAGRRTDARAYASGGRN